MCLANLWKNSQFINAPLTKSAFFLWFFDEFSVFPTILWHNAHFYSSLFRNLCVFRGVFLWNLFFLWFFDENRVFLAIFFNFVVFCDSLLIFVIFAILCWYPLFLRYFVEIRVFPASFWQNESFWSDFSAKFVIFLLFLTNAAFFRDPLLKVAYFARFFAVGSVFSMIFFVEHRILFLNFLPNFAFFPAIICLNLHFYWDILAKSFYSWIFDEISIFFPRSFSTKLNFSASLCDEIDFFRDHLSKFMIFFNYIFNAQTFVLMADFS